MKTPLLVSILTVVLALVVSVSTVSADTVVFKDGREINGVIKKVAEGKVVVDLAGEETIFDILSIASMDFNTPHALTAEHFAKDIEAQEFVDNMKAIQGAAGDIRFKLSQIEGYWGKKESVTTKEEPGWLAAKEEFRRPLTLYQELLDDLYFHVLAKVDEYNDLMRDARKVYVGVKGPFNVGSSLVPKDMEKLPLRKYVPATWWDTIYFNGYNMGYEDAVQNLKAKEQNPTDN
jgi:uncharacterized protein YkvS